MDIYPPASIPASLVFTRPQIYPWVKNPTRARTRWVPAGIGFTRARKEE
jgi:hypothetical protein